LVVGVGARHSQGDGHLAFRFSVWTKGLIMASGELQFITQTDAELEKVFTPPDGLDELGQELYRTLVGRMVHEARLMPMCTVQYMLLDVIASYYVQMKALGTPTSRADIASQKFYAEQWLKATVEFNKIISRAQSAQVRELYLARVGQIVMKSLETIQDMKERRKVVNIFMNSISAEGL
jgi:hypothetical protein